jgi:CHAT domain-containing protein
LWPVGSATSDFMGRFYAALARGVRPSEALHEAKVQALKGPQRSPLYWAPFILIST